MVVMWLWQWRRDSNLGGDGGGLPVLKMAVVVVMVVDAVIWDVVFWKYWWCLGVGRGSGGNIGSGGRDAVLWLTWSVCGWVGKTRCMTEEALQSESHS